MYEQLPHFAQNNPSEHYSMKSVNLQVGGKNKWQNFNKYNWSTRMQSLITANLHICKSSWIWWLLSLTLSFSISNVLAKPGYWSKNITRDIHRIMLALCIVVSKFVTKWNQGIILFRTPGVSTRTQKKSQNYDQNSNYSVTYIFTHVSAKPILKA
jgi:hypothetical protein